MGNDRPVPEPSAWLPGSAMSNQIRLKNGIHTNDQFRQFMQVNADKVIAINQHLASNQCCDCQVHYDTNSITPNTPYLYTGINDTAKPFGYQSSDMKEMYISSLRPNQYTTVLTQREIVGQK